jgi:hypothetical protein
MYVNTKENIMKQALVILASLFALSVLAAEPTTPVAGATTEKHEMKLAKKKDHSKDKVAEKNPSTKSTKTKDSTK